MLMRSILLVLIGLLPVVLVAWVVARYALNLPYWDDYLVQEHLAMLNAQGSRSQKLVHFFDQHWEHRIVWTRAVFFAFFKLNGSLNYVGLTVIGVSGLVGISVILFGVFRQTRLSLWYFLPIPFWLFTLQSHENLLWGMASIQNFWVLVFALGSFWALAQPGKTRTGQGLWRAVALVLAVLATFTSGNGALVPIAGGLVLVWQAVRRRTTWMFVAVWALVSVVSIGGYFYGYQRVTFFPSPFNYPFTAWIQAFFVFFGGFADPFPYSGAAAFGYDNPLWISTLVGALLVTGAGWLVLSFVVPLAGFVSPTTGRISEGAGHELPPVVGLIKSPNDAQRVTTNDSVANNGPHLTNDFFLGCALFLLATAVITVYSRVGFAGPGYLLQGRYKIYSALMLSVVYLFVMPKCRLAVIIISLTIPFSLFSDYLCLEGIINQHRRTTADYFNFITNESVQRQRAAAQVFVPTKPTFFAGQTGQLTVASWLTAPITTTVEPIDEKRFLYDIPKADALNPTPATPTDGSYIVVKSDRHTYLFNARPLRPSPMALSGFDGYFRANGIHAQVLKEHLQPGRYRIGVLTNRQGQLRLAMTNRFVTFTALQ